MHRQRRPNPFSTTSNLRPSSARSPRPPWGASNVQPRDQDNWLEDKTVKSWSYWDGRIVNAANGTYFIVISETRPFTIYTSKSLDGPWNSLGSIKVTAAAGFNTTNTGSNTTVWPNTDGSILATSRDGRVMVSTSGLAGPFRVNLSGRERSARL
jgi:hypothetical protein